jgi:hypothetical protein
VVVEIAPAEYATVGFDGSWQASYHLIDPVVLKSLKPAERTSEGQWYERPRVVGSKEVRVLWDTRHDFPLKVLTRSGNGNATSRTTVKLVASKIKQP